MSQLRLPGVDRPAEYGIAAMSRLRRFSAHRFVGRRDTMVVYDCDDDAHLLALRAAVEELPLERTNLLQAFAPDDVVEAKNRGFDLRPSQARFIDEGF